MSSEDWADLVEDDLPAEPVIQASDSSSEDEHVPTAPARPQLSIDASGRGRGGKSKRSVPREASWSSQRSNVTTGTGAVASVSRKSLVISPTSPGLQEPAAASHWQKRKQDAEKAAQRGEQIKMGAINTLDHTLRARSRGGRTPVATPTTAELVPSWPRSTTSTRTPPPSPALVSPNAESATSWRRADVPPAKSSRSRSTIKEPQVPKVLARQRSPGASPDAWAKFGDQRAAVDGHKNDTSLMHGVIAKLGQSEGTILVPEDPIRRFQFKVNSSTKSLRVGDEVSFKASCTNGEDSHALDVQLASPGTVKFVEMLTTTFVGIVLHKASADETASKSLDASYETPREAAKAWATGDVNTHKSVSRQRQEARTCSHRTLAWIHKYFNTDHDSSKHVHKRRSGSILLLGELPSGIQNASTASSFVQKQVTQVSDCTSSDAKSVRQLLERVPSSIEEAKEHVADPTQLGAPIFYYYDDVTGLDRAELKHGDLVVFRLAVDQRDDQALAMGVRSVVRYNHLVTLAVSQLFDGSADSELSTVEQAHPLWQRRGVVTDVDAKGHIRISARDGRKYTVEQRQIANEPHLSKNDYVKFISLCLPNKPFALDSKCLPLSFTVPGIAEWIVQHAQSPHETTSTSGLETKLYCVQRLDIADQSGAFIMRPLIADGVVGLVVAVTANGDVQACLHKPTVLNGLKCSPATSNPEFDTNCTDFICNSMGSGVVYDPSACVTVLSDNLRGLNQSTPRIGDILQLSNVSYDFRDLKWRAEQGTLIFASLLTREFGVVSRLSASDRYGFIHPLRADRIGNDGSDIFFPEREVILPCLPDAACKAIALASSTGKTLPPLQLSDAEIEVGDIVSFECAVDHQKTRRSQEQPKATDKGPSLHEGVVLHAIRVQKVISVSVVQAAGLSAIIPTNAPSGPGTPQSHSKFKYSSTHTKHSDKGPSSSSSSYHRAVSTLIGDVRGTIVETSSGGNGKDEHGQIEVKLSPKLSTALCTALGIASPGQDALQRNEIFSRFYILIKAYASAACLAIGPPGDLVSSESASAEHSKVISLADVFSPKNIQKLGFTGKATMSALNHSCSPSIVYGLSMLPRSEIVSELYKVTTSASTAARGVNDRAFIPIKTHDANLFSRKSNNKTGDVLSIEGCLLQKFSSYPNFSLTLTELASKSAHEAEFIAMLKYKASHMLRVSANNGKVMEHSTIRHSSSGVPAMMDFGTLGTLCKSAAQAFSVCLFGVKAPTIVEQLFSSTTLRIPFRVTSSKQSQSKFAVGQLVEFKINTILKERRDPIVVFEASDIEVVRRMAASRVISSPRETPHVPVSPIQKNLAATKLSDDTGTKGNVKPNQPTTKDTWRGAGRWDGSSDEFKYGTVKNVTNTHAFFKITPDTGTNDMFCHKHELVPSTIPLVNGARVRFNTVHVPDKLDEARNVHIISVNSTEHPPSFSSRRRLSSHSDTGILLPETFSGVVQSSIAPQGGSPIIEIKSVINTKNQPIKPPEGSTAASILGKTFSVKLQQIHNFMSKSNSGTGEKHHGKGFNKHHVFSVCSDDIVQCKVVKNGEELNLTQVVLHRASSSSRVYGLIVHVGSSHAYLTPLQCVKKAPPKQFSASVDQTPLSFPTSVLCTILQDTISAYPRHDTPVIKVGDVVSCNLIKNKSGTESVSRIVLESKFDIHTIQHAQDTLAYFQKESNISKYFPPERLHRNRKASTGSSDHVQPSPRPQTGATATGNRRKQSHRSGRNKGRNFASKTSAETHDTTNSKYGKFGDKHRNSRSKPSRRNERDQDDSEGWRRQL